MSTESTLRADIVEVGRRMYARGYTASNDGNISVRLGADRLLMTPKNGCKGFMTPDMMCITDLHGRKLQGDRDPSSEMLIHPDGYRRRPDVDAAAQCQTVQAPEGGGRRLVPDVPALPLSSGSGAPDRSTVEGADGDEEIRLTYRELSALIEDAIRNLR